MPLTISTNPLVGNFIYADTATLVLTLQTVADPSWNKPYWEASYGSFSDHVVESPTFIPTNRTVNDVIKGYRAVYMQGNWSTLTNFTSTAPYGSLSKNSGANAWDARATSASLNTGNVDGFYSFSTSETTTEKAGGLSSVTTSGDPNSATFRYAWHLLNNGTATIRRLGVALATNIPYSAGDIFKVHKIGSTVYFYKDNVLYYSYAEDIDNLIPLAGARTVGSTITKNVFYNATSGQEGSLVVPVYGVFPIQPNYSYDVSLDNNTLISTGEDGSEVRRKKGNSKKALSLQFVERTFTEYSTMKGFWDVHEKHIPFVYRDLVFAEDYVVRFDSGVRNSVQGADNITMQISIKEV